LKGKNITSLKPYQVARQGIIRTFQLTVLFMEFTVLENILIALHMKSKLNPIAVLFSRSFFPKSEITAAEEILEIVGLTALKNRVANSLPHGHQRLLGLGIGLAAEPTIMLLDEPVTGMNTEEKQSMIGIIQNLHTMGLTILLVEHDIRTVMQLCQRIIVLDFGKKIAEGLPDEIRRNQDVIKAYFGTEVT